MAPRSEPREDAVAGYRLADLAWTGRPALNHSVWIGRSIVMAAGGGTLMCLSSLGRVSLVIGETIDRYHVVEKLGQGGMGVVYKARDTLLGRFVALKALPPDAVADPQRRQRFLEEAKAASALQHPGIVSVYDVVEAAGQVFIVMEHVAGETLEQRMGQQALPLSRALRYGEQIADALARAHAAGIVHRDLKPSNIMVAEDDTAKVLDFGLAKLAEAPFAGDEAPTVSRGHVERLTREGAVVGTLAYMSPEQATSSPSACCSTRCSRGGTPSGAARSSKRSPPSARPTRSPRRAWRPACRRRRSGRSCAACTRSRPAAGRAWPTSRLSSATCAKTPSPAGGRE
jgi:serine/threonine protein kinase